MFDTVETIGSSKIQHGRSNNRIYLMKLGRSDVPEIISRLDEMAQQKGYTKIFAKIPEWAADAFTSRQYTKEAAIPGFYNGKAGTLFYAKFFDAERAQLSAGQTALIDKHIKLARGKKGAGLTGSLDEKYNLRRLEENDIPQLASVYKSVFASYPFPIFEADYLKKTMDENVVYFGVFDKENLAAASSAEMDIAGQNVEMTDFATLPRYAGNNFSLFLLRAMEKEMRSRGIRTYYTIARSFSAGMNITFGKMNYTYTGTLVNNTNIAGTIESMNVWYKPAAL